MADDATMTDPRPSEVQALEALLHQRTWLTHDVPQESPCGYCERVALWLDGQGVGVRVAPSPTVDRCNHWPGQERCEWCGLGVAPSPDAPGPLTDDVRWLLDNCQPMHGAGCPGHDACVCGITDRHDAIIDRAALAASGDAPREGLDVDRLTEVLVYTGDGEGVGYDGTNRRQYAANIARAYDRLASESHPTKEPTDG